MGLGILGCSNDYFAGLCDLEKLSVELFLSFAGVNEPFVQRRHTSRITKATLKYLNLPLIFTAPASFVDLPVEVMFAFLKQKDFKKSIDEIVSEKVPFKLAIARRVSSQLEAIGNYANGFDYAFMGFFLQLFFG